MKKKDIYGINNWGNPFLEILNNGNIGLKNPLFKNNISVDIFSVIEKLNKNLSPPYILRINDYLEYMINEIHNKFHHSIKEISYKNQYRGVFPVKVNQQAQVVEKIIKFGKKFNFGLEVGSKAELLIALSQKLSKKSLIICNGIKDEEFITLSLLGNKIGFKTILVIKLFLLLSTNWLDIGDLSLSKIFEKKIK